MSIGIKIYNKDINCKHFSVLLFTVFGSDLKVYKDSVTSLLFCFRIKRVYFRRPKEKHVEKYRFEQLSQHVCTLH